MRVKSTKIQTDAELSNDFLKNFRVIRYWFRDMYKIELPDLEVLLFLYTEGMFTKSDFLLYTKICGWKSNRLDQYIENGWIVQFRESRGNEAALYMMTRQSSQMIALFYKKIKGEELSERSPMFIKCRPRYNDKVYKARVNQINSRIRERKKLRPLG